MKKLLLGRYLPIPKIIGRSADDLIRQCGFPWSIKSSTKCFVGHLRIVVRRRPRSRSVKNSENPKAAYSPRGRTARRRLGR